MRKLFTFLCAALMSVGMWAAPIVVEWNSSDLPGYGTSFSKGGVALTCDMLEYYQDEEEEEGSTNIYGPGTFTTTLGNFTQIEVTAGYLAGFGGEGWSGSNAQKTWTTGNAANVSFDGDVYGLTKIVFTIEPGAPATVAVTGVTLNQTEAQMTVGGEALALSATVNPEGATDKSVSWSTSDANVATVDDGVVTAVASGTATITVTTTDGSYTATCAVTVGNSITTNESSNGSVVASSSSAAAGETITLTATPDDGYQLKSIRAYVPVFETLYNTAATVTGNIIQAQATSVIGRGWRVYNDSGTPNTLTVSSKDGETLINKIECTSTWSTARQNNLLSVSAGTLSFDGNDPSTKVTINNINAPSVTISGSGTSNSTMWCFSSVKVYYGSTDEVDLEISDTENANVKTFTMVDREVTISAEFEPVPTGFDITANLDPQNAGVYYSTFYHGSVDYALPANVKAYKAVISGSNLHLSEVAAEGDVLPKGNAVILRSSVKNYTLTPSDATPVSVGDDNDLEGKDDAIATPAKCYVLSCENNLVGFYQYGAANLNPHKAYVIYEAPNPQSPAPRRMPFIFDQATGMESIQPSAVSSQKVLRDGQLIIIRNGVEYNANGMMVK